MTTLRGAAQQALETLDRNWDGCVNSSEGEAITALRAELEQPERAQKMRDAGYTRRPTLREMAEPEQEPHWLTKELMADYLDMVAEAIEENRSEMLRHKAHWMRKRGEV